jgi:hypothetical protein
MLDLGYFKIEALNYKDPKPIGMIVINLFIDHHH